MGCKVINISAIGQTSLLFFNKNIPSCIQLHCATKTMWAKAATTNADTRHSNASPERVKQPNCETTHFAGQNSPFRNAIQIILQHTDYQYVTKYNKSSVSTPSKTLRKTTLYNKIRAPYATVRVFYLQLRETIFGCPIPPPKLQARQPTILRGCLSRI